MSRLSRFKKAPALKLPKAKTQRSRFADDSDDDDDFVSRPIKYKEKAVTSPKADLPKRESQIKPSLDTSVSQYFPTSKTSSGQKRSQASSCQRGEATYAGNEGEKSHKVKEANDEATCSTSVPIQVASENITKTDKGNDNGENENHGRSDSPPEDGCETGNEIQGKVVCPFCWKKLGDKLSGTTHVKACAKGVPIQRVIDAMQLQEKQIEEWEKLGLEFPGFSTNNSLKKPKAASSRARGGGLKNRKKKVETNTVDPEFELAVALSVSLHEELESRNVKENQFLIENGLEKEIGLVDSKPTASDTKTNDADKDDKAKFIRPSTCPNPLVSTHSGSKSSSSLPSTNTSGSGRRRGKKLQLNQLPLFTVNEDQKRVITSQRVTKIMEDSERNVDQEFYTRDKKVLNAIEIPPKRLVPLQNKDFETTMWSRANYEPDVPNESFSVLELSSSKDKLDLNCHPISEESEKRNESSHETPKNISRSAGTFSSPDCKDNYNRNSKKSENIPYDVKHSAANLTPTDSEITAIKLTKSAFLSSSSSQSSTSTSTSLEVLRNLKLPQLAQDVAAMLILKKGCDLILYGREEKAIKCHSFMLLARCPKLLKEVIEEKCGKSTRRLIPLTNYGHQTLKTFLLYVYTGKLDNACSEDLMEELNDLASTYEMKIDTTANTSSSCDNLKSSLETLQRSNVGVQTEMVQRQDASTTTEFMNYKDSLETGFGSFLGSDKSSQELFTSFDKEEEENAADVKYPDKAEYDPTSKEKVELSVEHDYDNSGNEDALSDVDLFADIENDLATNSTCCSQVPVKLKKCSGEEEKPKSPDTSVNEENYHERDEGTVDDELYFMDELTSPPVTLPSSEKKRSRSVSPIEYDTQGLYSATQIADILQSRVDAKKANKKLKLNYSGIKITCDENQKRSDFKEKETSELSVNVSGFEWNTGGGDNTLINVLQIAESSNQNNCATPKRNRLKSRRSISTPNLSANSPTNFSTSRFYKQQNFGLVEEVDPFGSTGDDSLFANIPDDILRESKTPKGTKWFAESRNVSNEHAACTSQKMPTPLSGSRRQPSRKDLSKCNDSFLTTQKESRKGRVGNGKAKAPPKIKFSSGQQVSSSSTNYAVNEGGLNPLTGELSREEVTFASQKHPQSQPIPLTESTNAGNGDSKSPMLNYSLIDTPVLKQELKKYGIKPLPRSKAKVLLRHIYKETHK